MKNLTTRRRHLFDIGVAICPIISGVSFGVIVAVVLLGSQGFGHASETGALVAGFVFASNAAVLCTVQSRERGSTPYLTHSHVRRNKRDARAS